MVVPAEATGSATPRYLMVPRMEQTTKRKRPRTDEDMSSGRKAARLQGNVNTAYAMSEMCEQQRRQIERLTCELEECKRSAQQASMRKSQDMYLGKIMEMSKHEHTIQSLRRRLARSSESAAEQLTRAEKAAEEVTHLKEELDEQEKRLNALERRAAEAELMCKEQESKVLRLKLEKVSMQLKADQLVRDKTSLENDLEELRELDLEDEMRRQRKHQGLPPAYADRDDENEQPPWRHEDSDSFDIANVKRTVRKQFTSRLHSAFADYDKCRAKGSGELPHATARLYIEASLAAKDACRALHGVLFHVDDLMKAKGQVWQKVPKSRPGSPEIVMTVTKQTVSHQHLGITVAKLVLDLLWRIISAVTLRPSDLECVYEKKDQEKLELAFAEMDRVLLDALRMAFNGAGEAGDLQDYVEYEFHTWELMIQQAREWFDRDGSVHERHPCFRKTRSWLGEQIELARARAARREVVTA